MARGGKRASRRAKKGPGLFARMSDALFGKDAGKAKKRSGRSEPSPHAQEIKALLLLGVSLWLFVSMTTYYTPFDDPRAAGRNWGGQVGFYLANAAFIATGLAGLLLGCLGACWGCVLLARKRIGWASLRVLGALCFVVSVAFLLEMGTEKIGRAHV